jgi:hypothetical protein
MKFMGGDPMKPATNRLTGRSYSSRGASTCCSTPLRSTANRSPSVIASTWSCVTYTVVIPSDRGLSAPRRADQDHEFAIGDVEAHVVDRRLAAAEVLGHVLEPDAGHGHPFTAPDVSPATIRPSVHSILERSRRTSVTPHAGQVERAHGGARACVSHHVDAWTAAAADNHAFGGFDTRPAARTWWHDGIR